MATQTQICNFIKLIAPDVQEAYKRLGKVKPSVCIGMACVESACGTAGSCKYNSFLGQKVGTGKTAKKYWNGTFKSWKTKEEYSIGTHTAIVDAFRTYDSMQQCVLNYYELLNTSLYKGVKSDADYRTQMQQIKTCGYMTSSTEVNSVLWYIEKFNLTQYDDICAVPSKPNGNPYKLTATLLKVGSRGESVKWLQYQLNQKGYNLACDGIYGQKTKAVVMDYQKNHGLVIDGIAGQKTLKTLQS